MRFEEEKKNMNIEVIFEKRIDIAEWSDQSISFSMKNGEKVLLDLEGQKCKLFIEGGLQAEKILYAIWELLAWYDGYFYKPLSYWVDGVPCDTNKLITLSYYVTDNKWRQGALLLGRNQRKISEDIILSYLEKRQSSRKNKKLSREMISSYFYLLSEPYQNVNIEHRLVLLMHICDGMMLNFFHGNKRNNAGNIVAILNKLSVEKKYQMGAEMLGFPPDKAKKALGDTRNELTHYQFMPNSLGAYFSDENTKTDTAINLYVFYILNIAVRIAMLESIGVDVEAEVKKYVLEEHLDWIRLQKGVGDCVIPKNRMLQMLRNIQNQ